jgi:hypothetical protein
MVSRCYCKNVSNYKSYGQKGIRVSQEWLDNYYSFKKWSMSHGYNDNLSLDRINNSLGYNPDNCRWVTLTEQCNNKTNNRKITAFGETKNLIEWQRDIRCPNVSCVTIKNRIKYGWTPEKAISTPVKTFNKPTTKQRLRNIHDGIIYRCTNKKCYQFKDYGGRGIQLCIEWTKFKNFYDWAINNGYKNNLTLDRIDSNGNYESYNCRWATKHEQVYNKRNTIYLTAFGETKNLEEWSKDPRCAVNKVSLGRRTRYDGWSDEKIITEPLHRN